MAGMAFLSAVLGTVSNEAGTLIHGELKLLCSAKEDLKSLKSTLSLIEKFLADAESKKHEKESVKEWLHNLKDVAYDALDVIDEAATEALRRKVASNQFTSCSTPLSIFSYYLIARKIKGVKERLEQIHKESTNLGLQNIISWPSELLDLVAAQRPPRETSSTDVPQSIIGRTKDLENLVQLLLLSDSNGSESGNKRICAISIVGMGGLGKTALAQLVYNDTQMKMHFDTKAWVHVSPKFDVIRLIGDILEQITEQRPKLTTLDTLQTHLGMELRGKRFLLVLDDVWNLDMERWKELCVPLHQAKVGSKVLITTRNQLGGTNPVSSMTSIDLGLLTDGDCWSIVESFAFSNGKARDHPRLERLGQEIAVKAKGVPLAAKALGGILNSIGLDENRWRGILEADVSQLREGENGIMPVLRLSYQYLPPHLKQCFAYCAVFPNGFSIDRDRLVWMWMASGFIQTQGNERMEDVGSDYFNALLGRSFFQYLENRYTMHDLMHELSQSVSEGECFVVEDQDLTKVPEGVRHLTLHTINLEMLEKLHKFQKLRSLLFFCKYNSNFTPVLEKLFKKLKRLRVLDLNCYDISLTWDCDCGFCCCLSLCGAFCCKDPPCKKRHHDDELPTSIGSLKHLRYLHLYFKNIHVLPESLGTLYNLQTLIIGECESLHRLPKGMSNLVQLRQLKANAHIISNIDDIGRLTSLQELDKFSAGLGKRRKLGELRDLNQIRGTLSISKLENVVSKEESMEARLYSKRYIDTLELEWSENRDTNSRFDEQVLEGLKPHANLKVLIMKNYGGIRSSGWMLKEMPPFLETVRLLKCTKLEEFPPLGRLRFLKVLEARGMDGIVQLDALKGFLSLEELLFADMPRWQELSGVEEGQSFRCLRKLIIHHCAELKRLPPLPPSLTKLELVGVGLCVLPEISGCPLKTEIISKNPLPSLNVASTSTSTTPTTKETTFQSLPSPVPEITENPSIESLFGDLILHDLEHFNSMKELLGLPKDVMQSSSSSSSSSCSSLSTLEISNCSNLTSLREGLLQQDLGALTTLRISDCEGLVDLPENGLPSTIQLLVINRCPLLKERCLLNGGPDWPKIAHIPYIQIDGLWINGAEMGEAINEACGKLMKGFQEFIGSLFSRSKKEHNSEGSSSTV